MATPGPDLCLGVVVSDEMDLTFARSCVTNTGQSPEYSTPDTGHTSGDREAWEYMRRLDGVPETPMQDVSRLVARGTSK